MNTTEMVSVPRELLHKAVNGHRSEHSVAIRDLRELLAQSAEQRQVEPVVLPPHKNAPPLSGDQYGYGWNACIDEIAKLGPLYTHPAPTGSGEGEPVAWRGLNELGEVVTEWIDGVPPASMVDLCGNPGSFASIEKAYTRADPGEVELAGWKDRCRRLNEESMAWMRDNDTLRAQLAEWGALLLDISNAYWRNDAEMPYALIERIKALSASAEPSAPVAWHVGGNGYDRICFEEPRDLPGHPCVQAISDQRQLISLLKRYNLRDEEPSAPAERDERAEFEASHVELFGCLPRTDDQQPDFALSHYNRWLLWQARAALERTP